MEIVGVGRVDQVTGGGCGQHHGLLDQDVDAGVQRRFGDLMVIHVRNCDHHTINPG